MKTTYKKILENIIRLNVEKYVKNKINKYFLEQKIELKNDNDFDYPKFTSTITINHQKYAINGYINDYGKVIISSIKYEYDYYKTCDDVLKGNKIHKIKIVYGEDLKTFNFKK